MKEFKTIEELLEYSEKIIGKKVSDVDKNNRLANSKNKGAVGQAIEEGYFGLPLNSSPEPDFKELGVELKVTPAKKLKKNGLLSSKEKLILNIINYMEEYDKDFKNSSFWKKNEHLLLVFYLWQKDVPKRDYEILASFLHEFSEEDLIIIKQDWEHIVKMIRDGRAHELSESQTNYLSAGVKGSGENYERDQPFSDKKARQRAYCLKSSYVTTVLRNHLEEVSDKEKIVKDLKELERKTLDGYLRSLFEPYLGKTVKELCEKFGVGLKAKSRNSNLIKKILSVKGDPEQTEEFVKANISLRTITLSKNDNLTESFKITNLHDFNSFVSTDWEDSDLYRILSATKFMFVLFKEVEKEIEGKVKKETILHSVRTWAFPYIDLEQEVYSVWKETIKTLREGVVLQYEATDSQKGYIVRNNLIKSSDNRIIHLRPSALKSQYRAPYKVGNKNYNYAAKLPYPARWVDRPLDKLDELDDDYMTKQALWINKDYLKKQLVEKDNDDY